MSLEQVESQVKALQEKVGKVGEVRDKLGNGVRFLHLELRADGFRQRTRKLDEMASEGREKTRELAAKLHSTATSVDQSLCEVITRRQKEVKALKAKASAVETVFKQQRTEGRSAEKHLNAGIKEEVAEAVGNFDKRLLESRGAVLRELDALKSSQSESLTPARKQAKHTLQSLADYTRDNAEKLCILKTTALMSQNRLNSEDAKALILAEVTGRLMKGVTTLKDHMENRSGLLSSKHTEELMKLRSEVEATKETILGQREETTPPVDISPVAKLTNCNGEIRRLLNHIGAFCVKGTRAVRENTEAVKRSMAVVDQEGISEQGQNLLKEAKKQLEACAQQLSTIWTKIKSDFYGVQEALKEGKALISLKAIQPDQKPSFDVQKDLRSRLEKEVTSTQYLLTRERVEKVLTEVQEEIRALKLGQEQWSQQLTAKQSSFGSPEESGEELTSEEGEEDFDDLA